MTETDAAQDAADRRTRELASDHDGPTAWFDVLYREAEAGRAVIPWDRGGPQPLLVDWLSSGPEPSPGERALVVGTGPGADTALLAERGYEALGFDVSPTAVRAAKERHGHTGAHFVTADLLNPPPDWDAGFDLVIEIYTVQSMPRSVRAAATAAISKFVAPGGQLLVISGIAGAGDWSDEGPPWPLTRDEIDAFAGDRLTPEAVDQVRTPTGGSRWQALFTRPTPG